MLLYFIKIAINIDIEINCCLNDVSIAADFDLLFFP